jgi:excisionase family DNA binding protein
MGLAADRIGEIELIDVRRAGCVAIVAVYHDALSSCAARVGWNLKEGVSPGRKWEKKFDPSAWISQSEAARLRRVTRQAIAELVQKNRFRVLKVGGKTLLSRSDVERYHPQQPGPEPQKKRKK